jgi:hypothetical protein
MYIYRPPFYGVYTTLSAPAFRFNPTKNPSINYVLDIDDVTVVSSETYSYSLFNAPWTLTYRNVKGSPLTFTEADNNFNLLNSYKLTLEEYSITTASSLNPNLLYSSVYVSALAENITIGAPSGTPKDGQTMVLKIKDNGTSRTLSFNAIYRPVGSSLPTSTTVGMVSILGFIYNGADSKWDFLT